MGRIFLVLGVSALLAGQALAHIPVEPSAPITLEQARHDRDAVAADWPLAREKAAQLAADLAATIARGDAAVEAARQAGTAKEIEAAVYRAWAAISHLVNVVPETRSTSKE